MKCLLTNARPSPACLSLGTESRSPGSLLAESDFVSLNLPLQAETRHIFDRGPGPDEATRHAGQCHPGRADRRHEAKKISVVGLDVYEEEEGLFFRDHGEENNDDDVFVRLLTFSKVVVTGHQANFTRDALEKIARTTLSHLDNLGASRKNGNTVCP